MNGPPLKQRQDEQVKENLFVSLPYWWRLLISEDSWAEYGWQDTLGTIQGSGENKKTLPKGGAKTRPPQTLKCSKSKMCRQTMLKSYYHVYLSFLGLQVLD